MPNFTGQLRANEVFAAIYNMIISQQVFTDNIDGFSDSLVSKARVDGSLYGDSKLYYSTDALESYEWLGDEEAANLLAVNRPKDPQCQVIHLDKFRQLNVTVDNYLTKRAWGDEGIFSKVNGVFLAWLNGTKKVVDTTNYNTFIGTNVSASPKQNIEIELPNATDEASHRLRAQTLAESIANLEVELSDVSRDFNDYGNLRAYKKSAIMFIWNSKFINEIEKRDLPTIYHDSKVFGEGSFDNILPPRYFGTVLASGGSAPSSNKRVRTLVEKDYGGKHLFPGDLIPDGEAYLENEAYTQDDNIICKVLVKLPPYMSSFEVGTSFFNARSLTTNHYLTFGRNTLEHLKNYPYITIKAKSLAAAAQKAGK